MPVPVCHRPTLALGSAQCPRVLEHCSPQAIQGQEHSNPGATQACSHPPLCLDPPTHEHLFATHRTHVPKQLFPDCMSMHALHRTDYSHHQQPLHSKGCNAIGVSCVCMTPHAEHLFGNTCSVDPPHHRTYVRFRDVPGGRLSWNMRSHVVPEWRTGSGVVPTGYGERVVPTDAESM